MAGRIGERLAIPRLEAGLVIGGMTAVRPTREALAEKIEAYQWPREW